MGRRPRAVRAWLYAGLGVVALGAAGVIVAVSWSGIGSTARCPEGTVSLGPHCCGEGQTHESGGCTGTPTRCAQSQSVDPAGCRVHPQRVPIAAVDIEVQISDWDLSDRTTPGLRIRSGATFIDRTEVTYGMWSECKAAAACPYKSGVSPQHPIVNVTPQEAAAFCAWLGGSLPTSTQWLAAAMGAESRRYPWGAFGLVCRRSAFGLASGPCASGATTPEVVGSRPDGATPEGVLDLSGNVAEWTVEGDGHVARGGSFRSTLANELKSLAVSRSGEPRDDVGFRCAYPRDPGP